MAHVRSLSKTLWFVSLLLCGIVWIVDRHWAAAHAVLVRAEPGLDQVVSQPPGRVDLWFSEPVRISAQSVRVIGPDGRDHVQGAPQQDPTDAAHLWVTVDAHEQGTYQVIWRLISADSHVVNGAYQFSVGIVTATSPPPAPQPSTPIDAVARWLRLLALSVLTGSSLFLLLLPLYDDAPLRAQLLTYARRASLLGVTAVLLWAGGQAIGVFGDLRALGDPEGLATIFGEVAGLAWLSQGFLFVLGYLLALWGKNVSRSMAGGSLLGLSVCLGVGNSLSSHASATPPIPLSVMIDFAHLLAATLWLGGLITLGLVWHAVPAEERRQLFFRGFLRRFSLLAAFGLYVALFSGAYQLWVNVGGPADLTGTAYGRILLLKGVLVVLLSAFALLNARWMSQEHAVDSKRESYGRWVPSALFGEAGIAFCLLLVVGVLTALPPARSVPTEDAPSGTGQPGLTLAAPAGTLLTLLSLDPAQPGSNRVVVTLRDSHGQTVQNATVSLILQPEQTGGQPVPRTVTLSRASDTYRGSIVVPQAGSWTMTVHITQPDQPAVSAHFTLRLPVPDAAPLLARADAAMNQLHSLQEIQTLSSGGPSITTTIRYQAPDRMAYTVEPSGQPPRDTVVVGSQRYDRGQDGTWTVSRWPGDEPFRWPEYHFAQQAEAIRLLDVVPCGTHSCYLIGFYDPTADARYRMWIDSESWLITRYEMMAVAHFMTVEYSRFNDTSISVTPPVGS